MKWNGRAKRTQFAGRADDSVSARMQPDNALRRRYRREADMRNEANWLGPVRFTSAFEEMSYGVWSGLAGMKKEANRARV